MGNSLSQDSQAFLEAATAGDAELLQQQIACEPKLLESVTLVKRRGVLHLAAKQGHPQVISTVLNPLLEAVRQEYHVSCWLLGLLGHGVALRSCSSSSSCRGFDHRIEHELGWHTAVKRDLKQTVGQGHVSCAPSRGDLELTDLPYMPGLLLQAQLESERQQQQQQPEPPQPSTQSQEQLQHSSTAALSSQTEPQGHNDSSQQAAAQTRSAVASDVQLPSFKRLRHTVNARDLYRRTPLIVAAKQGHLECTHLLVDAASNLFAVDREGNT